MNIALVGALGAMICWGIGDFLMQRTARKIGDVEALLWIGIIGAVLLVPFIIGDVARLTIVQGIVLLTVLGVVTFIAAIFDFEALREGKIAVIDMVVSLELPFTILLGVLFFHERLSLLQFIFIAILMLGISMISIAGGKLRFKLERGVWFALAAAVGMALVNFLTAVSSLTISPLMAVWFPWLVFTLLCLVIVWRRNNGIKHLIGHVRHHSTLILAMGVFDTFAWVCYAYALAAADLGLTTAITQSYPVVALLLGVTIGGERINMRQYVGAGVAIIASIALAFAVS